MQHLKMKAANFYAKASKLKRKYLLHKWQDRLSLKKKAAKTWLDLHMDLNSKGVGHQWLKH